MHQQVWDNSDALHPSLLYVYTRSRWLLSNWLTARRIFNIALQKRKKVKLFKKEEVLRTSLFVQQIIELPLPLRLLPPDTPKPTAKCSRAFCNSGYKPKEHHRFVLCSYFFVHTARLALASVHMACVPLSDRRCISDI